MGACKYCHKSAGFLRWKHKACEAQYIANKAKIDELIETSFVENGDFDKIKGEIERLKTNGYLKTKDLNAIYLANYDTAVQEFLYDGILTKEEEQKLAEFKSILQLDQDLLDQNGLFQKFIKAVIIRDLAEGKVSPVVFDITEKIPCSFEKDEHLIRLFDGVELYEHGDALEEKDQAPQEKFKTQSFDNDTIDTRHKTFIDEGIIAITDKYIHFASPMRNFTTDFKTFVSMTPYENGLEFQRNEIGAKPQIVVNIDGKFLYSIMSNLT